MTHYRELSADEERRVGLLRHANAERRRFELLRLGFKAKLDVSERVLATLRKPKVSQWKLVAKLTGLRCDILSKQANLERGLHWLDHKLGKELWYVMQFRKEKK